MEDLSRFSAPWGLGLGGGTVRASIIIPNSNARGNLQGGIRGRLRLSARFRLLLEYEPSGGGRPKILDTKLDPYVWIRMVNEWEREGLNSAWHQAF